MRACLIIATTVVLLLAQYVTAAEKCQAATPQPREEEWCLQHHESLKKRAAEGGFDVMLIGDSITWEWEANENTGLKVWEQLADLNPASFAVSGDRTEHLLWRLLDGELDVSDAPKAFVLMIGTNNTGQREDSPKDIAAGVNEIVAVVKERFPESIILVYAIFPRNPTSSDFARKNNDAANELISTIDDGNKIRYVNINREFVDADGNLNDHLFRDGVHLSEDGYRVWASSINRELKGSER